MKFTTTKPSVAPTTKPAATPTQKPVATTVPSATPTSAPVVTTNPTTAPTVVPTSPTSAPTAVPTVAPVATEESDVSKFAERLYTTCLGRASEPSGKAYWISQLMNGKTGAEVAYGFFFSAEFKNHNFDDEEFVTRLYRTFMDREPDQKGLSFWLLYLKSGKTRVDVFNGFINSTEWADACLKAGIRSGGAAKPSFTKEASPEVVAFATRLYTTCLGRAPESGGLNYWSQELANVRVTGTNAAMLFFFSSEFVNANYDDAEYVTRLYRTFMGREPDQAGFDFWVNALKTGRDRKSVFLGFAGSAEFAQKCLEAGIVR